MLPTKKKKDNWHDINDYYPIQVRKNNIGTKNGLKINK